MTELSSEHFNKLAQQIYLRLGLHFEDKKSYFLQKRVEKRMDALGYKDPKEYVFLLCYADSDGSEMQALANLITTNETYMFREYEQLEAFANCCLPEVLSAKQARGEERLRIWCAGCSSGEEAYTLAIILQEIFPQSQYWDCEIVATDIDQNMLAQARSARYWARSVREVPADYLDKYFIQEGESWVVRPKTRSLVRVEHLNLNDRMAMRSMRNFDFIFCRNVLIYFDDISRKTAVDNFYNSLNRGGYVFLGHSESIGRISSVFKLKRMDGHLVYAKE
jgi:chemotaxis protein methyltransferase CheR